MSAAVVRRKVGQFLARHVSMLTAIVVVVAASFAWENIHFGTSSADDQGVIIQVVQGSQLAKQQLCVPPGAPMNAPQAVQPSVLKTMLARVRTEENKYYSGRLLVAQVYQQQQNCSVSARSGNGLIVNGGVSSFGCGQIIVQGETGTADCQAVEWQKSLIRVPTGVRVENPRGPVNLSDSLVKTPAGWRITREKLSYPAGRAP